MLTMKPHDICDVKGMRRHMKNSNTIDFIATKRRAKPGAFGSAATQQVYAYRERSHCWRGQESRMRSPKRESDTSNVLHFKDASSAPDSSSSSGGRSSTHSHLGLGSLLSRVSPSASSSSSESYSTHPSPSSAS